MSEIISKSPEISMNINEANFYTNKISSRHPLLLSSPRQLTKSIRFKGGNSMIYQAYNTKFQKIENSQVPNLNISSTRLMPIPKDISARHMRNKFGNPLSYSISADDSYQNNVKLPYPIRHTRK
jgi:hypothetical protein